MVNRGFSGWNTKWVLPILDRIFPQEQEDQLHMTRLVTIFFGANDASIGPLHVPVGDYERNLKTIAQHVQTHCPLAKLVFITPPPVIEHWRKSYATKLNGGQLPEGWECDRSNIGVSEYIEACKRAAKAMDWPCIDIYTDMNENREAHLNEDGLHLNPSGYHLIYEHLLEVIHQNWQELHVEPEQHEGKEFRKRVDGKTVPNVDLNAAANFANGKSRSALPFFFPLREDLEGKQLVKEDYDDARPAVFYLKVESPTTHSATQ